MSVSDSAFPSSVAFDAIRNALESSPEEKQDAIKKAAVIVVFKLKNKSGEEAAWYIDLKHSGTVARGEAPAGKKADLTLMMSEDDFAKFVAGKTKAQNLFMSGKLKVKGNVMKAMKVEPILAKAQASGKAKL